MKRATARQKKSVRTLTVSIPLPVAAKITEQEAKVLLVLKLVDEGVLSQSQAAALLGVSRYDLVELMSQHNLPIVRYSPEDWHKENQVIEGLRIQRQKIRSG
jgi:predicted HTH domain antitoxin